MPFIVTTKRPARPHSASHPLVPATWTPERTERVAVATLEEAHDAARELCLYALGSNEEISRAIRDVFAVTESGGMLTLPDRTTIEVENRDDAAFAREMQDEAGAMVIEGEPGSPGAILVTQQNILAFNVREAAR